MAKLILTNPATGEKVGEVTVSTKQEINTVVSQAKAAYTWWKYTPVAKRIDTLKKLPSLLSKHREELAMLTTREMGKPIVQSRDDVNAEISFIEWYIAHAQEALQENVVAETREAHYMLRYEPYGVCASIAPWNFPITMVSSGIIQAILAGNTVVFKPSEYTTLTQKRFIELLWEAGVPKGIVGVVYGAGEVGKMLTDCDVDVVWFTGSTTVGQEIYKKCATKFIKAVMELGGSSPGIVFGDCDLTATIEQLYWARFLNCGQVCNAVKRLFVQRSVYQKIIDGLVQKLKTVTVGDPLDGADIGPLVSKSQVHTLMRQVADAKKKGAHVVTGGGAPKGGVYEKGNYYMPTIITHVTPAMRVMTEEVFGPVLPIIPFETEEEAIALANDTPYGLSAEIYTSDKKRAQRVSERLDVGIIGINTDNYYVPFCPTGGYKKSGMGREYGIEGFRELSQVKYICRKK